MPHGAKYWFCVFVAALLALAAMRLARGGL